MDFCCVLDSNPDKRSDLRTFSQHEQKLSMIIRSDLNSHVAEGGETVKLVRKAGVDLCGVKVGAL